MYDHPAYAKLQELGKEIVSQKPKAVIVFSAHWQADEGIEVNVGEDENLIYDFFGFPSHFYKYKFPVRGSSQLAGRVLEQLRSAGIRAEGTRRGFDHGVWVGLSVAFKDTPLTVPLIQVSLYSQEDAHLHYKLGQALAPLRDEGVMIIGSGMSVHNLRDFARTYGMKGALPYAISFDKALKEAAETPISEREQSMAALLERKDARQAHPTFEHLLPVHIAAGAAYQDAGKQVFTLTEGSLSWGMYRFGEVQS